MSLRKIAMLAALCALAAMSLVSSASAATFIHSGSTTGPTYSGAINATQTGGNSTLSSSAGHITCTAGRFAGTIGASGGHTVTGTLTQLTFTNCSDNIPFITITSCHRTSSSNISATATGTGTGNLTIPQNGITVTCYNNATMVCSYTNSSGPITGALAEAATGTNLSFSGASITGEGGICPNGTFSATYGPLLSGSTFDAGSELYISHA